MSRIEIDLLHRLPSELRLPDVDRGEQGTGMRGGQGRGWAGIFESLMRMTACSRPAAQPRRLATGRSVTTTRNRA